jgi:small subunit ribosomal protein S4
MQFLESRCDTVLLKAGVAQTIMQARQMLNHGHFALNGVKHTIPSTMLQAGDVLEVRPSLKQSTLYKHEGSHTNVVPARIKVDAAHHKVELIKTPEVDEKTYPVDVLKVIEFYARA